MRIQKDKIENRIHEQETMLLTVATRTTLTLRGIAVRPAVAGEPGGLAGVPAGRAARAAVAGRARRQQPGLRLHRAHRRRGRLRTAFGLW